MTMKIYFRGEFAKMFNLSKKTIARYQERGLLPTRKNPANGYMFFTDEDVENFKAYLEGSNAHANS